MVYDVISDHVMRGVLQCDEARKMSERDADVKDDVEKTGDDDYRIIVVFVAGVTGGLLLIILIIFLFKSCFRSKEGDTERDAVRSLDDEQNADQEKYADMTRQYAVQ